MKKKKNAKKTLIVMLAGVLVSANASLITAEASEFVSTKNKQDVLVNAGYTKETAEALDPEEMDEVYTSIAEGEMEDVTTSATEVDNLDELENILCSSSEELQSNGISEQELESTADEVESILSMDDSQLKEECNLDDTEVKLIRKIEEKAIESSNENMAKELSNEVSASGSISSAKLTYTQSVANQSTKSKPQYVVKSSYSWKSPFLVGFSSDKIIFAWGGNLECKSYTGKTNYYTVDAKLTKYKTKLASKKMSTSITPNLALKFSFPQTISVTDNNKFFVQKGRAKSGTASVTLYQNKKKGYSTKVVSRYAHRTIKGSGAVSISKNGPSVNLGTGWDATSQKKSTIGY